MTSYFSVVEIYAAEKKINYADSGNAVEIAMLQMVGVAFSRFCALARAQNQLNADPRILLTSTKGFRLPVATVDHVMLAMWFTYGRDWRSHRKLD